MKKNDVESEKKNVENKELNINISNLTDTKIWLGHGENVGHARYYYINMLVEFVQRERSKKGKNKNNNYVPFVS